MAEHAPTVDGLAIDALDRAEIDALQALFERCSDFHELLEGVPTLAGAAAAEYDAIPPGKSRADKLVFGIRDSGPALVGVVDLIRDYPHPGAWWLGLLMLDPTARARGLGSRIYHEVARWAAARGADEIYIGVLAHSAPAERFWRRHGFRELRRQPYVSDHGHESVVIVMTHRLRAEA